MCKLSILIPTTHRNKAEYHMLLQEIYAQITDQVELLTCYDQKEMTIGAKRQYLIEQATGEYVVFIDDDDWIAPEYISSIMQAIEDNPDGIGFYQRCTSNGQFAGFSNLSGKYDEWADNVDGFAHVRTLYHKTPIKRNIALKIGFDKSLRFAEDHDFSKRLKKSGLIQNEVHIPFVLYYYRHSSKEDHEIKYGFKTQEKPATDHKGRLLIHNGMLRITHNAGFFSCCTIALQDIALFIDQYGYEPEIDRSQQFEWYKENKGEDISKEFFTMGATTGQIYETDLSFDSRELQFSDYKKLNFAVLEKYITKYFSLHRGIFDIVKGIFNGKMNISGYYCAVFYRGNDKNRETKIGSYEEFINKAKQIKASHPHIKFILLPDETEFEKAFMNEFPDTIVLTRSLPKCDSCMPLEIPQRERIGHAKNFLASVFAASQCGHLITHSGNGGLWSVIFRGDGENVHQYLNGEWV